MSGEFVARMEDVLDLYQQAYHPSGMCFDETSRQLTGEVRPPIEAAPGRVARYDTEYQRNGTRNLFMICEPKGGWRHVAVTERRTAVDFAHSVAGGGGDRSAALACPRSRGRLSPRQVDGNAPSPMP